MPQNVEENDEGSSQNMVSNLPLLFAEGYPSSLETITEKQLEQFIPFMVQCSLGYVRVDYSEPEWWPEDVQFTHPFVKPKNFKEDWSAKMKEIVVICYTFHKSIFLLRFCNELASYEREFLRFINNYNSTTSLFDRVSNRLLVTFRNENMLYDQQINHRKCLLPRTASSQSIDNSKQMVEQALFDIYLCDNCDAELYSFAAYKEHEKSCQSDDDVIICEPEPETEKVLSVNENHQKLSAFLLNFNLQSNIPHTTNQIIASKEIPGSPEKSRRFPRRARGGVVALSRCPTIQITSPLGQILLKKSKSSTNAEYVAERLERIEKFSYAPPLKIHSIRPKWLDKKYTPSNTLVTYKRPVDHDNHCHVYKFPKRQYSTKSKRKNFMFLNSILLKSCRPCSISVKKLTESDVQSFIMKVKLKSQNEHTDNSQNSTHDYNYTNNSNVIEYINLCSSDDDNDDDDNDITEINIKDTTDNDNVSKGNRSSNLIRKKPSSTLITTVSTFTSTSSSSCPSPSTSQTSETIQNQLTKPLRPVFLFSNINNNNLNNTKINNKKFSLTNQQNQENHSIKNWNNNNHHNDITITNNNPNKLQTNKQLMLITASTTNSNSNKNNSNGNSRRSLAANS